MRTVLETGAPARKETALLVRLSPGAWILAAVSSAALLIYAVPRGEDTPLKFAAIVFAFCGVLWVFPFSGRADRRGLVSLFLIAFSLRLMAAAVFDSLATSAGDSYAASPDAWFYDLWATRLVSAWSELRNLTLHAYDAAGRWDVGFHYILAAFYATFGRSILGGRVLGAFFGAAAVFFFFLAVRRLAGVSIATVAGLVYAFWVSSIAWSGFSVLRDSLVWALTFACVWLALVVADGSIAAGAALCLGLVLLRTVRPYAEAFVVAGIAVAGALALVRRSREALRPAVVLAAAVLAAEAILFAAGLPSVLQMVPLYKPRQVLMKPLPEVPLSEIRGYPAALPPPVKGSTLDEELKPIGPPRRLLGPSLPANTLRFFLSPPGWAPVRGGIRVSENWHLPGMWLWYAILPVAALGFFVSVRGSPALQSLTVTAGAFAVMLIVVGRGDSARQREMIVPIFLVWFAIGLGPALRRPRVLAAVYLLYATILGAGIVYHRGTLRARGMVDLETPRAAPARCRDEDGLSHQHGCNEFVFSRPASAASVEGAAV